MSTTTQPKIARNTSDDAESDLPEGWAPTFFTDIFDIQGGTQPPKAQFVYEPRAGYVRLLQIRDFGAKPVPTYIQITNSLRTCCTDDILIGRYGASVGRICTGMEGAYNVALAKVIQPKALNRKFVIHLLNSEWFQHPILSVERSAQDGFNKNDLARIVLPIPPITEQECIVAKIEELLKEVNASRNRLTKVPKILKRFRQSILAAACSGRLTEDWRERNPDVESVDVLLTRLRKAGAEWYEPIFEKREESDLPERWAFAALGSLGQWGSGGTPSKSKTQFWEGGAIPWVSPKDMKSEILADSQDHITLEALSETNLKVHPPNTLLFVVRGMILAHTFPIALTSKPLTINQDIRSLEPYKEIVPEFLLRALASEAMSILFAVRESTHGTKRLESETLKAWPIALPPFEEQHEIVRRVQALFKLADMIEKRVEAASKRADKLSQAILAKAFRGELVPTEAELARSEGREYEPASVLLARIKAECERSTTSQSDGKRPRRTKSGKK